MSTPRPDYQQPALLALVFLGGALGAGLRGLLAQALPPVHGVDFTILAVNTAGAFILGLLLEALLRRGPESRGMKKLRLFAGTGFMGGFTTYSTLAVGTLELLLASRPLAGAGYALATLLLGALATWAGIFCGHRAAGRKNQEH